MARISDDGRVPTLNDLARRHTALTSADIDWLHALVSDWQLLADLSFADLVLWAPLQDSSGWVVLAQMRPTTGPTTFHDDVVGSFAPTGARPFLESAQRERRICREGDPEWTRGVPVRRGVDPGHPGGPGHRGHRAEHQPELGAHAEPPGADLPQGRGRPGPDGRLRHVSLARPAARAGPLAAGGGRAAPARPVRQGQLREPQRAVRLPQAGPDRRPGRVPNSAR